MRASAMKLNSVTETMKWMGLICSLNIPTQIIEILAMIKKMEPILPIKVLRRYVNSPKAKIVNRMPPIIKPLLNRVIVTPGTIPKSLNALLVQLNSE